MVSVLQWPPELLDTPLSLHDLADIHLSLRPFYTHWSIIALHLGIPNDEVKIIEENYPNNIENKVREMLSYWILNNTNCTRRNIKMVLEKCGYTSSGDEVSTGNVEAVPINFVIEKPITTNRAQATQSGGPLQTMSYDALQEIDIHRQHIQTFESKEFTDFTYPDSFPYMYPYSIKAKDIIQGTSKVKLVTSIMLYSPKKSIISLQHIDPASIKPYLTQYSAKWQYIGQNLGLPIQNLRQINNEFNNDLDKLEQVITIWHRQSNSTIATLLQVMQQCFQNETNYYIFIYSREIIIAYKCSTTNVSLTKCWEAKNELKNILRVLLLPAFYGKHKTNLRTFFAIPDGLSDESMLQKFSSHIPTNFNTLPIKITIATYLQDLLPLLALSEILLMESNEVHSSNTHLVNTDSENIDEGDRSTTKTSEERKSNEVLLSQTSLREELNNCLMLANESLKDANTIKSMVVTLNRFENGLNFISQFLFNLLHASLIVLGLTQAPTVIILIAIILGIINYYGDNLLAPNNIHHQVNKLFLILTKKYELSLIILGAAITVTIIFAANTFEIDPIYIPILIGSRIKTVLLLIYHTKSITTTSALRSLFTLGCLITIAIQCFNYRNHCIIKLLAIVIVIVLTLLLYTSILSYNDIAWSLAGAIVIKFLYSYNITILRKFILVIRRYSNITINYLVILMPLLMLGRYIYKAPLTDYISATISGILNGIICITMIKLYKCPMWVTEIAQLENIIAINKKIRHELSIALNKSI